MSKNDISGPHFYSFEIIKSNNKFAFQPWSYMQFIKVSALILLIIFSFRLVAQKNKEKLKTAKFDAVLPENIEWGEGSILLNDGDELRGLVKYNDKNGVLSFENGKESRAFTSRSVAGFEVYDHVAGRQRIFYSLDYEDPKNNVVKPLFFELVKDFKSFAVLVRKDPIEMKDRQSTPVGVATSNFALAVGGGPETVYKQNETIYFLNAEGTVEPYLTITQKEVDGFLFDSSSSKNKVIDKNLLSAYIGEDFSQLKTFAEENNLSFKRKEDLFKILDYYEQLLKARGD